ncbi:MAG TPA: class I SAM-dependent methyltransferase [Cellvibrionaceae bacterium]
MSSLPAESNPPLNVIEPTWVRETRFGRWFLGTKVWYRDVLSRAFADFSPLIGERLPKDAAVLDAGCGEGLAFKLIEKHFTPRIIFGLEIDKEQISKAIRRAARVKTPTHVMQGDVSLASFQDNTFDIIFAHQILHHTADQEAMVKKFMGLLRPGGLLLSAESCRAFIESWPVKLLFRHPDMAQKSAQEYLQLIRACGLIVDEGDYKTSRPWWSRRTLGLAQKIGIPNNPEPTEILIVARKPDLVEPLPHETQMLSNSLSLMY